MLFKVDENLHPEVIVLLQQRGHDAVSVRTQGLRGASDRVIADVCQREERALLTLDLDFGDIRAYPPEQFPGLVVLRMSNQSRPSVLRVVERMLALLDREPLLGHLWIVEEHRVRIRHAEDQDTA
jgi:predicted nuclease of predicted toxin-antitoxin system